MQISMGYETRIDEQTLRVQRKSTFTGKTHVRDLPITDAQWRSWKYGSALIQDAFPHLSASDREFLMTGATQEEWDAVFGKEEE